jgi:hypothetical protein
MRASRAAAFALALAILAPSSAGADPTTAELAQARELFAQAERDERAGDWTAALGKLRFIEKIKSTPGIRFHIAMCEENTGQLAAALADYAFAERRATDEKNREVLAALKEPMAALRARVPRLVVRVPPDVKGATVALDGKVLPPGYYGAEIPVDPRAHAIEAKAPGKKTYERSVTLAERDAVTVDVVLDDDAVPASPPPLPLPATSATLGPAPNDEARGGRAKVAAIAATAGAIVLAGAGVGAFLVAGGKQSDAKDACAARTTDCEDLREPVRTWDTIALGSWIAAGAVGTVAVLLWLAPDPSAKTNARSFVFVGPGSAGVAGAF